MDTTTCQEAATRSNADKGFVLGEHNTKVVGLIDPRDGLIKVIFETVKIPKYCVNVMLKEVKVVPEEGHCGQLPKNRWLRELLKLGLTPSIKVLGSNLEKGSKAIYIRKYANIGSLL